MFRQCDPKKPKFSPFFHFFLFKFLVSTLQCAETLILYLFAQKVKTPSKVAYFNKIAESFSTAKDGLVCPDIWKLT